MLFAFLGTAGLIAIEASYTPQIFRLWKRKHADDVSVLFPALNALGRVLAVIYAAHQGQSVFVVGFLVGIAMRTTLLSQVLWYRFLKSTWVRRRALESA